MTSGIGTVLVALALTACTSSTPSDSAARSDAAAAPPALEGTAWKLVEWPGHDVPQPPRGDVPAIRFEGGRVAGTLPCNGFSAGATLAGSTLTLGPMMSTKRACEALAEESALSLAMSQPLTVEMSGTDGLVLRTPDGVVLRFVPDSRQ
jgi:heat shock protein HslJ